MKIDINDAISQHKASEDIESALLLSGDDVSSKALRKVALLWMKVPLLHGPPSKVEESFAWDDRERKKRNSFKRLDSMN